MTVRPNAAILRFQSVVEQSKYAVMDKDDRDFVNDLRAVLHWLDFAEQALARRDTLLMECAELFRRYEVHHTARATHAASKDEASASFKKAETNGQIAARIEKLLGLDSTIGDLQ